MVGGASRIVALVATVLVAGAAAAQDGEPEAEESSASSVNEERARAYFMLGRSHYDAGEYAESVEQFEQAYALSPQPRLLYNLYQAHHRLGQLAPAIDYLERYLADGEIDDQERPLLEARLENHRESLAAERQAAAEQAERERLEEEARQAELAEAREAAAQASPLRTAGWVVLGVGLAGAGAFALFGALALRENADLAERCGEDAGAFCDDGDLGTLQLLTRTADLGGAVGLAGIATGIVLLLIGRPEEPDAEEARLLPTTLPGGAGLQLRGRF